MTKVTAGELKNMKPGDLLETPSGCLELLEKTDDENLCFTIYSPYPTEEVWSLTVSINFFANRAGKVIQRRKLEKNETLV